jgi:hypothetical protein
VIEPRHPKTSVLSTLLHRADLTDYETTARAIEELFDSSLDEYKAELYARLQDTLLADDTFAECEHKVNAALSASVRAFA